MKPKYKKLRAIRPNKGIEMDYRKKLAALIARMQKETQREILRAYQGEEAQIAADAVPANVLYRLARGLRDKYQKLFNKKVRTQRIKEKQSNTQTNALRSSWKKLNLEPIQIN